ncbi:MAG TPA: phosphate uptake regulator PhoU [Thermoplasmata archaeon]|nr:phosphate uptake regulator PhoU [Thermoplasmata archaeon]
MEGRKLQLAGKSTFLVSLPKRWVTNAGLKAGDTLFVDTEVDGSVSVRTNSGQRSVVRRKVFHERTEESRDHLLRKLIGAYVSGFGLIEVRFAPDRGPFVRKVAREFCRLVIGPEVIEENPNSLLVQDLSDPSELSSEKCLRRMHLTVRAMLEDAVTALGSASSTLTNDVKLRGQDVNRLYWMVAKQFHLAHTAPAEGATATTIHGHRLIAKLLERIGDHAQRIAAASEVLSREKGIDPKLLELLSEARSSATAILDTSLNALFTRNIEMANEAIDARVEHQRLIDALKQRVSLRRGAALLALGTVVDSLGRSAVYAAEIAEETIDLSVLLGPPTA